MRNYFIFCLSVNILMSFSTPVCAFDNGPTWFGFNYTLNISGARTIAMGGAAVASVGDAGATLSNPAALICLSQPEFRIDSNYRHLEEKNRPGSVNAGSGKSIRLGLHVEESNQIDPALMAIAVPLKDGQTAFGLFSHEFLPYDRYVVVTDPVTGGVAEEHSVMFDLDEFGFSVARSFFGGRFAMGLSASWVTPNMTITAKKDRTPQPGSFDGEEFTSYGSKSEQEPLWRFGLLFQPADTLSFGLKYTLTQDPQYTMTTVNSSSTVDSAAQNGGRADINTGELSDGTLTGNWLCESSIPMPVSLAFGIAYKPNESWNIAVDAIYIEYSRATREFTAVYAYPGGDVTVIQSNSDFKAEDVMEIRFGFEYNTRLLQLPLALRVGYYYDPAHDIRYNGPDSTSQVIYPGGEDVQHLTAGAGILFKESLQVDIAVDTAENKNHRAALSLAYKI